MAAKQEVTAEEELTVKTQARAPSAGVVLQKHSLFLTMSKEYFTTLCEPERRRYIEKLNCIGLCRAPFTYLPFV